MKIALIRPPKVQGGLEKSSVQQPINLAVLAAVLRRENHELAIWDLEVEPSDEFNFTHKLIKFRPDLVGFTALSATIKSAAFYSSLVKNFNKNIWTVIGGPHATAIPEITLKQFKDFDLVVVGEGEETIVELSMLLQQNGKISSGILGTAFRHNGKVQVEPRRPLIKDLDTLPYPARDLLQLELYQGASTPGLVKNVSDGTELFTSRGCMEKCIFCAQHNVFSHQVRFRSAEHVLGEIRECQNKHGFHHFTIEDDTFTLKKKRLFQLCQGFKELNITWDCDTRVDAVDQEILQLMADSGCLKVAFGIESGSPRILKLIKKRLDPEKAVEVFKKAKQAGLYTQAFFIVGSHPSENVEDLRRTENLMQRLDPDFALVNVMTPFPGTELYDLLIEKGYLSLNEVDWNKFDCLHGKPTWRTDQFSPDQLLAWQRRLMLHFSLRPKYILKTLKKMLTWTGLGYYLKAAFGVISYLFWEKRK